MTTGLTTIAALPTGSGCLARMRVEDCGPALLGESYLDKINFFRCDCWSSPEWWKLWRESHDSNPPQTEWLKHNRFEALAALGYQVSEQGIIERTA